MREGCGCFSSDDERRRQSQKGGVARLPTPARPATKGGAALLPIQPAGPAPTPQDRQANIKNVGSLTIPGDLQRIADTFIHLYEARTRADYDLANPYAKGEVVQLLNKVEWATLAWDAFRATELGFTFLVVLLPYDDLKRHG